MLRHWSWSRLQVLRVLVVDDYGPVCAAVRQGLAEEGYAVDTASTGTDALRVALDRAYDVIVLDVMLPGLDGITVLRQLRAADVTSSVLLLTARDATADRVGGLDAGADDYLTKPFELAELIARVKALVRRAYRAPNPLVRVGDLEIDTSRRTVHRAGEAIALSAREYGILEYLALRAGQLVSRTEIWEHVYDFRGDARSNVIDVYMGYLRKKIEREGWPRLLHTRRGHGYVLTPDL
jgi:DNA-binding response OmpR family regulator